MIGDGKLTMDFSRELFNEGVFGTGIAFPTVAEGKARIRTIMTATHTKEELEQALEVLGRVGREWGLWGSETCVFSLSAASAVPNGTRPPSSPTFPALTCGANGMASLRDSAASRLLLLVPVLVPVDCPCSRNSTT